MSRYSKNTMSNLIPCLRYRDVPAALQWLCRAFDFQRQRVVEDEEVGIIHAQLGFGSGMVMLGPVTDSEYGRALRQPDEVGGVPRKASMWWSIAPTRCTPRPRLREPRSSSN